MGAIFKREFKSYFTTPVGYIVLAAFYFFLGLFFSMLFGLGAPNVEVVISSMAIVIIFIIPVITMRLMSEDRRQRVDQALFTAPVSLTSVVLGKYFAAMTVFALGFAPTLIFQIIVMSFVKVSPLPYIYGILGMMLLASALISLGMFISSLTESSVVSAILTLIINILVLSLSGFASMIKVQWIANALSKLAFTDVFEGFFNNIFSFTDIIYFLSFTVAFIFLCIRSLEKKRWA